MKKTLRSLPLISGYLCILAALLVWQDALFAQTLTVTPITWPTIGLDSNNVNVGPNTFPIGVRVTNTGGATATDVKTYWFWDGVGNSNYPAGTPNAAGNSYGTGFVHLRPGTLIAHSTNGTSIAAGAYRDFYFEIEVTRDANAYNRYEQYYIQATSSNAATVNGPKRQVGVEYLISQSRNSVQGIAYSTSLGTLSSTPNVPLGGSLNLTVGNTYYIKLFASTATNGYEQLTAWINFPNTIFRIDGVTSTYTANTSPFVSNPSDKLYANGCNWDEDPTSPTYASCTGTGKAGGTITTIYQVRILASPSSPYTNPQPLQALTYDFSGSSFHYNSDFSQTWFANIIPGASFSKDFSPNPILAAPANQSVLTFSIGNLTATALSNVSFSDTFPAAPGTGVDVAATPGVVYTNCGSPSFTNGGGSVTFTGISIAVGATCTIAVNVTAPTAGSYPNTSDSLFIDGVSQNLYAKDTLVVLTGGSTCTTQSNLASWLMNLADTFTGTPAAPPQTSGAGTGTASICGNDGTACNNANVVLSAYDATGNPTAGSWGADAGWYGNTTVSSITHGPYLQFAVDTTAYTGSDISISFDYEFLGGNSVWFNGGSTGVAVYAAVPGGSFTSLLTRTGESSPGWIAAGPLSVTPTTAGTTYFRVTFTGNKGGGDVRIDNVVITATCTRVPIRISKSFLTNPVSPNGGTSTLRFTITNPSPNPATSGITFADVLPAGLTATNGTSSACGGTNNLVVSSGNTITMTAGSLGAGASSCNVDVPVTVTPTTDGPFNNISGTSSIPLVADSYYGQNPDSSCGQGVACATLDTAKILISKSFSPESILTNGTSTLTFTLRNPTNYLFTSVAFSDTYPTSPGSMVNTSPTVTTTNTCGGTLTATAGSGSMSLSGGQILANTSCTISVTVTAPTAGNYVNTSTAGTFSANGTTLPVPTATDTLNVHAPINGITILKRIGPTASGPWTSSLSVALGASVFFQYTVDNTGEAALSNATIVDSFTPALSLSATPGVTTCNAAMTSIPVFGSVTCVSDAAVTVNATGVNNANVTANAGAVTCVTTQGTPCSSAAYNLTNLVLDKKTTTLSYSQVGDTISYTYDVTTSVTIAGPVTIADDRVTVTCPNVNTIGNNDANLDPGETLTCGPTLYTVTANDINNTNSVTNTAIAHAGGSPGVYSNPDSVTVPGPPYNYGGLPVGPFTPQIYNIFPSGGARNLTCSTRLGASVESNTTGGPSTDPVTYSQAATWNGIVPTPNFQWSVTNGGSLRVTSVCPSTPCFLNGWIDWNQDGDFSDTGEFVFNNYSIASSTTQNLTFTIPGSAVLTGTWYARFRFTDDSIASPSSIGSGPCGEVEDYALNATSLTSTPVTLAYFKVYGQGNRTRFEWSTASEAGNLGFDLYAATAAGRQKVTTLPVRSTATDPTESHDYEYEATVDSSVTKFYLEDIDISGRRRQHGPFDFGKAYGKKPNPSRSDWARIRTERDRNQRAQDAAAQAAMASGKTPLAVNLLVKENGLYRVTYEALLAAGFNLNGVSPDDIVLLNKGVAVPIEITDAGLRFGPGSAIQFYGTGLKTLYTYNNVYKLMVEKTRRPVRVASDPTAPSLTGVVPASYLDTVTVEKARKYDFASPASDPWYDTMMFTYTWPVSSNFPITLDAVAGTSGATLSVNYYGVTAFPETPDHHAVVQLNGSTLIDDSFDGRTDRKMQVPLPSGLIQEGSNTLTLSLPGDAGVPWDLVNLKSYAITYPRQFIARNGRLIFSSDASVFRVDGLPSANAVVYRVLDGQVSRLSGAQVQASGNGFAVRFPGSGQRATYVVTTVESALAPAFSVPSKPSILTGTAAQMLIISHPDFISSLSPLVAARQAEGLSVKVVDVNAIYTQYSHGIFDPAAIKSYIADAAANMGTRYVLLVGGDTYDYRNDLGVGAVGFLPTLYAQTDDIVAFAPVDPLFGDIDGDNVPDLAIGRFPVRTTTELDALIRKTLAYGSKTYGRTAVFAADKVDPTVSFKAISQSFISSLPAGWTTQQANIDDGGLAPARSTLLNAMNSGVALVNYVGHSSFSIWTFDPLFSSTDAVALTNFGKPFFASQYGCWNTYFVSPYYDTLAHALLLTGDQGAAGVMGGSTLTQVTSDYILGQHLVPFMTAPGKRLGEALNEARQGTAAQRGEAADVILGWVLLGDPTMVIER